MQSKSLLSISRFRTPFIIAICFVAACLTHVAPASGKSLVQTRPAAELGDIRSELVMGDAYFRGQGIPKDAAQAAYWHEKAARDTDSMPFSPAIGKTSARAVSNHGSALAKDRKIRIDDRATPPTAPDAIFREAPSGIRNAAASAGSVQSRRTGVYRQRSDRAQNLPPRSTTISTCAYGRLSTRR